MKTKYFYQLVTCLLVVSTSQITQANNDVIKLTQDPKNWATWGGDYAGTRYSELNQINSENVKNLAPAWTFSTGVLHSHEGGALVVNDVIYIHTPFPNKVYTLDQKTKSVLWEYSPHQDTGSTVPVMCCNLVNRGLAYAKDTILLQLENQKLALYLNRENYSYKELKNNIFL